MSSSNAPERAGAPAPPRWGLGDVLGGLLAGLVLTSVTASIWLGVTGEEDLGLGGQGLAQLGLWAGLLGAAMFASRYKGAGTLRADFGFRLRRVDVPVGLVVGLLAQVVLVPAVAFLLRPLVGRPDVSGPAEELFDAARGVGTAVLVLFVAVGAPVVEELFFRGLLLGSLRKRLPATASIGLSAAIFGLAHPQPLALAALALVMVSLAALGVVLAVMVVRTGRLGGAIVAHAAFNLWTAVGLLVR